MRPQIRSIPLNEIECPQFGWATRNNSANISAILQPDLQDQQKQEETAQEKEIKCKEEYFCPRKRILCTCDNALKPTLFSHPVTCVCSKDPCPPRNEIYRHYDMKMENRAIGDIMEETIMASSFPSPTRKAERSFRKTIISSHTPEKLRSDDNSIYTDCVMRESPICRRVQDCNTLYENYSFANYQPQCTTCKDQPKCVNTCKGYAQDYVKSSLENPWNTDATLKQNAQCDWRNDSTVFTCKQEHVDRCIDCKRYMCTCENGCTENICKSSISEVLRMPIVTNKNAAESVEKTTKEESPLKPRKAAELVEMVKAKSPKEFSEKSSNESSAENKKNWNRPDKLADEQLEILKVTSYENQREKPTAKEIKKSTPLELYEHYHNPIKDESESTSRSSSKNDDCVECANTANVKNSADRRIPRRYTVNTCFNPKKPKPKQKTVDKYPWNFNNQPKVEDPMKHWTGTKYSWSKKAKYPKVSEKTEIGPNNFMRSRAGDDFGDPSQRSEPEYFEYKPNLGLNSKELSTDTEENIRNIKMKERRRYKRGFGKMRVKSWHRKLDECAKKLQEQENMKQKRRNNNSKNHKEKNIFSDDDIEDETPNECKTIDCVTTKARDNKTNNQADSFEKPPRPDKKRDNNEYSAANSKSKHTDKSVPNEHPSDINNQDGSTGDQFHNKRKHLLGKHKPCCHLSTIFEECPGRFDCNNEKGCENTNSTCQVSKLQNKCTNNCDPVRTRPKSACAHKSEQAIADDSRPRSADTSQEDSIETPYFNVIRQKIHSRTDVKLEDLRRFRDKHFFETHNTKPYQTDDDPAHICVHRFTVDERLYPQPLHSNALGVSCCIHCDKPMRHEKTVFSDQREPVEKVREPLNRQKRVSKFCLRSKPVHIGSGNSVMEIKLGPEHRDLLKTEDIVEPKTTYYANSLALRYRRR